MAEVIGVRFKNMGKVYYFDPNGEKLENGDRVVVETARGVECGDDGAARERMGRVVHVFLPFRGTD